jgi:hypothetical protein
MSIDNIFMVILPIVIAGIPSFILKLELRKLYQRNNILAPSLQKKELKKITSEYLNKIGPIQQDLGLLWKNRYEKNSLIMYEQTYLYNFKCVLCYSSSYIKKVYPNNDFTIDVKIFERNNARIIGRAIQSSNSTSCIVSDSHSIKINEIDYKSPTNTAEQYIFENTYDKVIIKNINDYKTKNPQFKCSLPFADDNYNAIIIIPIRRKNNNRRNRKTMGFCSIYFSEALDAFIDEKATFPMLDNISEYLSYISLMYFKKTSYQRLLAKSSKIQNISRGKRLENRHKLIHSTMEPEKFQL